jgi:YVTN family beta-propeller protein
VTLNRDGSNLYVSTRHHVTVIDTGNTQKRTILSEIDQTATASSSQNRSTATPSPQDEILENEDRSQEKDSLLPHRDTQTKEKEREPSRAVGWIEWTFAKMKQIGKIGEMGEKYVVPLANKLSSWSKNKEDTVERKEAGKSKRKLYVSLLLALILSVVITLVLVFGSRSYWPRPMYAYTANYGAGTVSVIDTTNRQVVATLTVGKGPKIVVANPALTRVYVINYDSNSLSVINPATNQVIATILVGEAPQNITISPDGKWVYVTNSGDDTVSIINADTNRVEKIIKVGKKPGEIFYSPDGKWVYVVSNADKTVTVISTADINIFATIAVGNNPGVVAFSANGLWAYIVNRGDSSFTIIDTVNVKEKCCNTIALGSFPQGVAAIPPQSRQIYITVSQGKGKNGIVCAFDTAKNAISDNITVEIEPTQIVTHTDGKRAYVVNLWSETISILNSETNQAMGTMPIWGPPWGVAITPDGKEIYVTHPDLDDVTVLDTTRTWSLHEAVPTIRVGNIPYGIAIAQGDPSFWLWIGSLF